MIAVIATIIAFITAIVIAIIIAILAIIIEETLCQPVPDRCLTACYLFQTP